MMKRFGMEQIGQETR